MPYRKHGISTFLSVLLVNQCILSGVHFEPSSFSYINFSIMQGSLSFITIAVVAFFPNSSFFLMTLRMGMRIILFTNMKMTGGNFPQYYVYFPFKRMYVV